jgi:FkbM family methyltransferase
MISVSRKRPIAVRAAMASVLRRAASAFQSLAHIVGPPPSEQELRVRPWRRIRGDATLRLQYDLDSSSMVFDVGGYEGDWASEIAGRYGCTIHIFEPVPEFATKIQERLGKNAKIHVHAFGLAASGRTEPMRVNADSSSIFRAFTGQEANQVVRLLDITEFFERHQIRSVDLLKINIEGGEYELLERLVQTGEIMNIRNVQVQFHDFVENAEQRMRALHDELERTHYLTYQFPFVWENWRRKAAD